MCSGGGSESGDGSPPLYVDNEDGSHRRAPYSYGDDFVDFTNFGGSDNPDLHNSISLHVLRIVYISFSITLNVKLISFSGNGANGHPKSDDVLAWYGC